MSTDTPAEWVLDQYPEKLAVIRLGVGAEVPAWAESASLFAVIATARETTVVAATRSIPPRVRYEGPFTAFAVAAQLDFDQVGVLVKLLSPLAAAQVSSFVVSTFSTDWILLPQDQVEDAVQAWDAAGILTQPAPVIRPAKR